MGNRVENELKRMGIGYGNTDPQYVPWAFRDFAYKQAKKLVERDLQKREKSLIDDYVEYFTNISHRKEIFKGEIFHRARAGLNRLSLKKKDDKRLTLPYIGEGIGLPPKQCRQEGRFNTAEMPCLYLADSIETCLAEIGVQAGEICSVGEFICQHDVTLLDLTDDSHRLEEYIWIRLLTHPVFKKVQNQCDMCEDEEKIKKEEKEDKKEDKYKIPNFLAKALRQVNPIGIYFHSVQSMGNNLAIFDEELFKLKEYSEETYQIEKISVKYDAYPDMIEKCAQNGVILPLCEQSFNLGYSDDFNRRIEYKRKIKGYTKIPEKDKLIKMG